MILKGIMTVRGAEKAVEAGAAAIVVSNHGGRVLPGAAATADVLPEIADAVGGRVKILVDGGIRSGTDIFRALALGADAVMICRPFLISYYGGGTEGIVAYVEKLRAELTDAMYMCGARRHGDITRDMGRPPRGALTGAMRRKAMRFSAWARQEILAETTFSAPRQQSTAFSPAPRGLLAAYISNHVKDVQPAPRSCSFGVSTAA